MRLLIYGIFIFIIEMAPYVPDCRRVNAVTSNDSLIRRLSNQAKHIHNSDEYYTDLHYTAPQSHGRQKARR